MRRFMVVGLGILLGLAAVWAGDGTATAPATRPAFEALAGLDLTIQKYKKGLDPAEEARLKKLEDHLKESLKSGWKPTWSDLDAKLTDKEIESLSTTELSRKLFDNGLPARTLMLYDSANAGIRRLEVLYRGYKELFHRPDCWKGLVASMDFYAAQLDVHAQGTVNVNAITGLMTVPEFYSYPPIRANITGHEREVIAAHVRALKKLSAYLSASVASTGTDKPKPFFAGMAPSALINWALAVGQGLSEQQYQAARAALSHPKWARGVAASDMQTYIDEAAIVLQQFANLPAATQPENVLAWRNEESDRLIGLSRQVLLKRFGGRPLIWNGEPIAKFSDKDFLLRSMPAGVRGPEVWGFQYEELRPGASLVIRMWVGTGIAFDAYWCRTGEESKAFFNPPPPGAATQPATRPGDSGNP